MEDASVKSSRVARRKRDSGANTKGGMISGATRRQSKTEAKRLTILNAALQHFAESGFSGTSVDDIAQLAEVSKTNLFYYFKSKQEIYVDLIRRLLDVWLAPLEYLRAEDNPATALEAYIGAKLDLARSHPKASKLFCLEIVHGANLIPDDLKSNLKSVVDQKAEVITSWIAAGKIKQVDPYHLIFMMWSATQHYADFEAQVSFLTGRSLNDHSYFNDVTASIQRIIIDGVVARDFRTKRRARQSRAPSPSS